jgi:heterodisulfide reductase subunit B
MNARNIALSDQHNPGQDIVATCAACWLGAKESQERINHSTTLTADINDILKDAGLKYEGKQKIRHMVEVLIEDLGYEAMAKPVKKPLEGIKIAGYVGCQTNRPFGVDGESFENPKYLDKLTELMGAEAVEKYDQKVTCCGGALAFSEPEKSQAQIKKIIESAYDFGAEMIVTPCPVCQMNVEVYQGQINKKYGTKFKIPVLYYSQLMAVAYGASAKEAGLDGNIVRATKLEEIAAKK